MSIRSHGRIAVALACLTVWLSPAVALHSQTLGPDFVLGYTVRDVGFPAAVQDFWGSILFKPGDSSTLLVGGTLPEGLDNEVFEIKLQRDATGHISGFSGDPVWRLHAPGDPAAMDPSGLYSGWDFGPNGVLFYPTFDASIAQIQSGQVNPSRYTRTQDLGIDGRVSGLAFVPPGFPGAGRLKLTAIGWLDTTVTPDGAGTFNLATPALSVDVFSPDGFLYAKAGLPGFTKASVLVAVEKEAVKAYEVDANGDPVLASERVFISDFGSAQGAIVDPVTGDFLLSSSDVNQPRILVVGNAATGTPTVSITSPANGSQFQAPATFALSADANEDRGSIGRVDFYQGPAMIASISAPRSFETQVDSLLAGEYDFRAIAFDAVGRSATSQVTHVSVINLGPIVTLLYPINNTTLRACSDVWFSAQIQAGNTDIATVEFSDTSVLAGSLSPSSRSETVSFVMRHANEGQHAFSVRVTDMNGLSATAVATNVVVLPLALETMAVHHYNLGELQFCFKGTTGTRYAWEKTDSLPSPGWVGFFTNTASAQTLRITNSINEKALSTSQFYRTRKLN